MGREPVKANANLGPQNEPAAREGAVWMTV
jgi:hypothetical protein